MHRYGGAPVRGVKRSAGARLMPGARANYSIRCRYGVIVSIPFMFMARCGVQ